MAAKTTTSKALRAPSIAVTPRSSTAKKGAPSDWQVSKKRGMVIAKDGSYQSIRKAQASGDRLVFAPSLKPTKVSSRKIAAAVRAYTK